MGTESALELLQRSTTVSPSDASRSTRQRKSLGRRHAARSSIYELRVRRWERVRPSCDRARASQMNNTRRVSDIGPQRDRVERRSSKKRLCEIEEDG